VHIPSEHAVTNGNQDYFQTVDSAVQAHVPAYAQLPLPQPGQETGEASIRQLRDMLLATAAVSDQVNGFF
jgi:hypothetical protein